MPRRSVLLFAGVCFALAALLAAGAVILTASRGPAGTQGQVVDSTGQPAVGGPFHLIDHDGRPVDQSLLNGKWSLVFFGFTYCPDYCPTTLATLKAVQDQLGPQARDLQILFVSIDPERDTPRMLKDYLSSDGFPAGTIGLTGDADQVAGAARAYRAFYEKVGTGETYTMNHSLTIYLMGPDGRFRSALAHDLGPERAAQVIRNAMERG